MACTSVPCRVTGGCSRYYLAVGGPGRQLPTGTLFSTVSATSASLTYPRYAVPALPSAASAKESGPASTATEACKGCCGAGAAAARGACVDASASIFGISASALFSATSALMVPVYALMAFFPTLKLTRTLLLNSSALFVGLSLLYAATLAGAWRAGLGAALGAVVASLHSALTGSSGLGLAGLDLSPLAQMFSQPLVTLLCWLHLLALDALIAREIALDGILTRTPTSHSVLLCFFFGPTGLLSHALTRLIRGKPAY